MVCPRRESLECKMNDISIFIPDVGEKEAKVKESVEKAKEAVSLDVKDGTSWSKTQHIAMK